MEASTKQALEESIAAWERKLTAETVADVKTGPWDCPLCVRFLVSSNKTCGGCPVHEKGHSGCRGTPYEAVYSVLSDLRMTKKGRASGVSKHLKSLIQDEVDFLKSLRPQE